MRTASPGAALENSVQGESRKSTYTEAHRGTQRQFFGCDRRAFDHFGRDVLVAGIPGSSVRPCAPLWSEFFTKPCQSVRPTTRCRRSDLPARCSQVQLRV